jgi:CMP-N-acetylneuraminic acid synthetase
VAGRPLYAYILDTLLAVPAIDRIVVDTDSPIVRDGVAQAFPGVQLIERPADLRADDVPINRIIAHDVEQAPAEHYLQTHATNPLLLSGTIAAAIEMFLHDNEHDSLFSVTPLQVRLWTEAGEPINHDPYELLRTQDLTPVFQENSCLYLFRRDVFLARGNRLGRRPRLFVVDQPEAWDVDQESDVDVVEAVLQKRAGA